MRVRIVDSHTGGEPTRVVIDGGPALAGPFAARVEALRCSHDHFRSAVVNEPRGSDVLVGALLTPPLAADCTAGVIFFNNVGYLGMCGHGTIGTIVTLAWLGRITPGEHRLETPVGIVTATLHDANTVSVRNVPAWRHAQGVRVEVDSHGSVSGDIAWGGNWFFLCEDHGRRLALADAAALAEFCGRIRRGLARAGITGAGGAEIDHIELSDETRNFVLCPGGAYDRSPCGTGTSAKLACLAADGRLAPGEVWRQTGITGSVFEARYERSGGAGREQVIPTITGQAWVTAEATLVMEASDTLAHGIRVAP